MPTITKQDVVRNHIATAMDAIVSQRDPLGAFLALAAAHEMLHRRRHLRNIPLQPKWDMVFGSPEWGERLKSTGIFYNFLKHDNRKDADTYTYDFDIRVHNDTMCVLAIVLYENVFNHTHESFSEFLNYFFRKYPDFFQQNERKKKDITS
jgi:hypothetical protein